MQCIRAFVAQQPDELSLEKADIILVHQQSSDRKTTKYIFPSFPCRKCSPVQCLIVDYRTEPGIKTRILLLMLDSFFFPDWVEGTRLSDRHRGWVPESHLETIGNSRVRQRNLSDALKLTTATAAV